MFKKIITAITILTILFSFNFIKAEAVPASEGGGSTPITNPASEGNKILETIVTKTGQKSVSSVPTIVNRTIKIFLGLSSSIFLIFLIVGGFQYLGSKGNTTKIKDSFNLIKTGAIGLSVILLAYAITRFILSQIGNIGN